MKKITREELQAIMRYDHLTGEFHRIIQSKGYNPKRRAAGTKHRGYRRITIKGEQYAAHILAWLYIHGEWPTGNIDHKNRNKMDNRIENLRVADRSLNRANSEMMSTNTSGFKGVNLISSTRRWTANISYKGKRLHLGTFASREEASQAYKIKLKELYPQTDFEESMLSKPVDFAEPDFNRLL